MTKHKQAWAKVNASVDEGIVDLVEILSAFPELQTTESCEDNSGYAIVFFHVGHSPSLWYKTAEFVFGIAGPILVSNLGDLVRVSIQITESGLVQAELEVATNKIGVVVDLLKDMISK